MKITLLAMVSAFMVLFSSTLYGMAFYTPMLLSHHHGDNNQNNQIPHHHNQKRGLNFHPDCVLHSHPHTHSRTNQGEHSHHSGEINSRGGKHFFSGVLQHEHAHSHYSNICDKRRDEPVFWFRQTF